MRHLYLVFALALLFQSCIPLRIAPSIEDYKVKQGKKFKKGLPSREMFVFEDPKDENHFYKYINFKFDLNDSLVDTDVPFKLKEQQYFFSFYEVEIPDKAINLAPMITSVMFNALIGNLEDADIDDPTMSRNGNWYLAIEVYSDLEKDCLEINSLSREVVLKYLRTLKKEYLSTHNYNEIVFKN